MPQPTQRPTSVLTLLTLVALAAPCPGAAGVPDGGGRLENAHVVLEYDRAPFALRALRIPGSPREIALLSEDLWQVELFVYGSTLEPGGVVPTVTLSASMAAGTRILVSRGGRGVVVDYAAITLDDRSQLEVDVELWLEPGDRFVSMAMRTVVRDRTTGKAFGPGEAPCTIHSTSFPRVRTGRVAGGTMQDERLAVPFGEGMLIPSPAAVPGVAPWVYPGGLSMQWTGLYDQAAAAPVAMYFAAHDGAGHTKHLETEGRRPTLVQSWRHFPADHHAVFDYTAPYTCALGVVAGDWYDCAKVYRGWMLDGNDPTRGLRGLPAPLHSPASPISTLLKDADLHQWIMPQMRAVNGGWVSPDAWRDIDTNAVQMKRHLGADDVTAEIRHWDYNSFDANVGEWFPIRNRAAEECRQMRAAGISTLLYFDASAYSMGGSGNPVPVGPLWAGDLEHHALQAPTGGAFRIDMPYLQKVFLDPGVQPGVCHTAQIDLFSPRVAGYLRSTTRRIAVDFGAAGSVVEGFYLDAYTVRAARLSYRDVGHPLGGGNWFATSHADRAQDMLDELRRNGASAPFLISEGPSETLLGQVGLSFSNNRTGMAFSAPLFRAVYHDYHRTTKFESLHVPQDMLQQVRQASGDLPAVYRILRQSFGAAMFSGALPYAGIVSADVPEHLNAGELFDDRVGTDPGFARICTLMKRCIALLEVDAVRRHVVFGERMRDVMDNGSRRVEIPSGPLFSITGDLVLGRSQPYVYVSSFRRGTESAALWMVNWTARGDEAGAGFTLPGAGGQDVRVTVSAADLGLDPNRKYRRLRHEAAADEAGADEVEEGEGEVGELVDFSRGPVTFDVHVPGLSAVCIALEPVGGVAGE